MTNRRHFFLIENSDIDTDRVKDVLMSAGFQSNPEAESSLSYESAQILLRRSPPGASPSYVGGVITPDERMIRDAKAKSRLVGSVARLFMLSLAIYVAMWIAAFIVVLTGTTVLLQFLGPAIPVMFIAFMGLGACTSGLFYYLDYRTSKQNQNLVGHACEVLVPFLQDALRAQVTRLSISTKLGDRGIKEHIPEVVAAKIDRLEFGHIDAWFWD